MSQNSPLESDQAEMLGVESGLEALRSSPAFRGPVEPHEGHDSNDHIALIYDTPEEKFAAAIPFIEQGLKRGERCMYIADEHTKDEITSVMRAEGVDIEEACDSGALTFHTKQDTYYRNGEFDPDEMIAFFEETIEGALDEYAGLRIGSEATWILGEDVDIETFMAYEQQVTELFNQTACTALCEYNRDQFPAEVIRDVIRTHPHLIYDNAVCQNNYYTPPAEFFGPDQPEHEVERMLNSLYDRTTATVDLREHKQELQQKNERLESFASMLAHELRNPLQIAQIYQQQATVDDEPAAAELSTALERMEEMIDVLLVTARGSDSVIDWEPVMLADVAADAWADVSPPDAATIDIAASHTIETDVTHLRHLLKNLFVNAIEHGDDAVTIRVGDLPTGFYVEDDGPGIPKDERETVLEAGYSSDTDAIGLGLTFVKQLADTYGWEFTLMDSAAGGTRFEFRDVDITSVE